MRKPKYLVEVREAERALRTDKRAVEIVKGAVGRKLMKRMRREYVECPVTGKRTPFLECFACISFIRRVKGVVHCAGEEFRLRS